jgi:DnaD/phage-associated family protein
MWITILRYAFEKGAKQVAQRTKKAVIKEELVELTGDYKLAIVLNQMIYWSERVSDFDSFISEEKQRLASENIDHSNIALQNGWIYKKAEELAAECMITNSEATMRRYLDRLCENNWLSKRRNPKYKWDNTLQYRVNIEKIQKDLLAIGYCLEGYRFSFLIAEIQNDDSNFQNDESDFHGENTDFQNENMNFQNDDTDFHGERTIPEITSEITSDFEKEAEEEAQANPYQFFEQNGFGTIGGYIGEKIGQWSDDLSPELVLEAMKIAVEYSAKNWAYVERILRTWAEKKITTVEQAHALLMAFKEQKAKQRDRPRGKKAIRKELLPDWFDEPEKPPANIDDEEFLRKKKELEERIARM